MKTIKELQQKEIKNKPVNDTSAKIIYLLTSDLPVSEISSILGIKETRINKLMSCLRAKKELAEMRFRVVGEDPQKAFNRLVPESIAVQAEVMRNTREKGAIRLMAASQIQDRAMGKPKQQLDINHKSQVRQILEMLQGERSGVKVIETTGRQIMDSETISDQSEVPDSFDIPPEDKKEEFRDDVDEWIAQNI